MGQDRESNGCEKFGAYSLNRQKSVKPINVTQAVQSDSPQGTRSPNRELECHELVELSRTMWDVGVTVLVGPVPHLPRPQHDNPFTL